MKKIAKFLIVLGMMGQLSSCDYLDIVPDERAQESDTMPEKCTKTSLPSSRVMNP